MAEAKLLLEAGNHAIRLGLLFFPLCELIFLAMNIGLGLFEGQG